MALPLAAAMPALAGNILTDILGPENDLPMIAGYGLTLLLWLLVCLPCMAITFRRLHDTGRSGFWALAIFIPFGIGRLIFFMLTLGASKTENNKYTAAPPPTIPDPSATPSSAPPTNHKKGFTPFYMYWMFSLRNLNTFRGRASRPEFWSFIILSLLLFLPFGYNMVDYDSMGLQPYAAPSREFLLYAGHPQDALILIAHLCFNPTFYFFYQSGDLGMLSIQLLIGAATLNILFNAPVAIRRLHDSSLSGWFIFLPISNFLVTTLMILLLKIIPDDITSYLPYLKACSTALNQLAILFLAMMLLKGTAASNQYGPVLKQITVP